eukprot:2398115-Rhodomonas_salina.1
MAVSPMRAPFCPGTAAPLPAYGSATDSAGRVHCVVPRKGRGVWCHGKRSTDSRAFQYQAHRPYAHKYQAQRPYARTSL